MVAAAVVVVVAAAVDFLQWLGRIPRPLQLQKSPRVRPQWRPVLWSAVDVVVAVEPTAVGSIAVAVSG